jgi:hypothetical protein
LGCIEISCAPFYRKWFYPVGRPQLRQPPSLLPVRFPNLPSYRVCPEPLFEEGFTADSTVQPFCVVDFVEEILHPLKNVIVILYIRAA